MANVSAELDAKAEIGDEFYREYFQFLVAIAVRKFNVPEADAEDIAQRVMLMYLEQRRETHDVRSWLIGAICHASRYYWRENRKAAPLEADDLERPDPSSLTVSQTLSDQIAAREAMEGLSARQREILVMRYFLGYTIVEIADRLGVKPKYAQHMLSKVLRRAEKNLEGRSKRNPESVRDAVSGFVEAYRKVV